MFPSIDDQIVDYSTINVNSILFSCSFYDSVPPQKIRIIENSRQVSSVIGPYDEGDQLSLNCIVTGGIQLLVPYPNWTISVIGELLTNILFHWKQVDHVQRWAGGWTTNWWTTLTLARRRMSFKMSWWSRNWSDIICTLLFGVKRPTTLVSTIIHRHLLFNLMAFKSSRNIIICHHHITPDNNNTR